MIEITETQWREIYAPKTFWAVEDEDDTEEEYEFLYFFENEGDDLLELTPEIHKNLVWSYLPNGEIVTGRHATATWLFLCAVPYSQPMKINNRIRSIEEKETTKWT